MKLIRSIKIDTAALAKALQMPEAQVIECFRDGRVSASFAECWVEKVFRLLLHPNKNHKSSDGFLRLPDWSRIEVSIRTLTKGGIKFQRSKFMGCGRGCTMQDLKDSIRSTDLWIVVNVKTFPRVWFYPLKCAVLERWMDDGVLKVSGLSYDRFVRLLKLDDV